MKKFFIFASVVGIAAGVVFWLYKKDKINNTQPIQNDDDKGNITREYQEENISSQQSATEDMYQVKNRSAQAVSERHQEASSIMKDAYSNIMENFVEDFSEESCINQCEENNKEYIDNDSVSIMEKINSISDEIDNL